LEIAAILHCGPVAIRKSAESPLVFNREKVNTTKENRTRRIKVFLSIIKKKFARKQGTTTEILLSSNCLSFASDSFSRKFKKSVILLLP